MKKFNLYAILVTCLFIQVVTEAQSNSKGFLPDSCSYTVLSQPSRVTKSAQMVYGNNLRFPFLLTDGTMVLISNDEIDEAITFPLPDVIKDCESAFILDSLLICKYSKIIKRFDGERVDTMLIMPNEQYNIYPANDGLCYLVNHDADSSSVYLVQTTTGKLLKLFDAPFLIDNVAGTGLESFVTSDERIYYVSDKICTLVEVADSKVQSIDFYSDGAFYSTETACYYLGLPGKSYPFLLGDIKQLMLVDNRLYLLFRSGLLSVIDKADRYQLLLNEVMNELKKNENEKH